MKKISALFLALIVSVGAFAQEDKQMANHLALGVSLGIDGIGLEAALPISPYVQARAGYSIFPYTYKRNVDLGTIEIQGIQKDLNNIPVGVTMWKGGTGKVLFDIFPGKKTPFHFTVGVYMGSGRILNAPADLRNVLDPSDYATLAFSYGKLKVSTDEKGYLTFDEKMGTVRPYVGIGFGRAIKPDSRVRVTFDMGAIITGGTKLQTYNYVNLEGKAEAVAITSEMLTDKEGKMMDDGWINKITNFPVLPMLKLNVFVRLF